jgi:hypothetical protein
MSSILDSKSLISSIRRRAFIPRSQETFTDEDFLQMATEEINIGLMDQIMEARGDYLVYYKDFDLVDTNEYEIPSRAHGNKLRDISIVDANGRAIQELSQITLEELSDVDNNYSGNFNVFYLRNNYVILPDFSAPSGYKLRMWFYLRPNTLVINDRGAIILSIADAVVGSDAVKVLSFSSIPKHFSSASLLDSTAASSPNKIIYFDMVPVSVNLTLKTITFLASDVTKLKVGDVITSAEETIIPNLPTEYHPIVAQRVAIACLEAMGDEQNKQSAERKLAQMEKAVLRIVSNRVEGAPKKIRQRHGTLNQLKAVRR